MSGAAGMLASMINWRVWLVLGWLADRYSMRVGFLVPLACFAGITAYGFGWPRLYGRDFQPEA